MANVISTLLPSSAIRAFFPYALDLYNSAFQRKQSLRKALYVFIFLAVARETRKAIQKRGKKNGNKAKTLSKTELDKAKRVEVR
jgi:hypothetical protein